MRIPKHIGIIPDGNRRWATSQGKGKEEGYQHGLLPGLHLLQQARACGVEEITYYGFTMDNCKRPAIQQQSFIQACEDAIAYIAKEPVSLLVLGNEMSRCFPESLKQYRNRVDLNGGGMKVNFLVNYGWNWDLSALSNPKQTGETILEQLQSKDISRIDLIIRWGGMRRLSGFLPVQSVYADFYVIEHFWPELKQQDLLGAIAWYQTQDVTLGG